jgi:type IV pilus assembly protein PilA
VIRSQVSEGSSLADGMKTAVAEFYNNNGRFSTAGNISYGLANAASIQGTYVVSVGVDSTGRIRAHYSSTAPKKANTKIDGLVLAFSPVTHAGSIEWNCDTSAGTSQALANKWRSTICRD